MTSELQRIKDFQASTRATLNRKAIRWCVEEGIVFSTLREAIREYLAELDCMDCEWVDWIDAYGEAKLISLRDVDI